MKLQCPKCGGIDFEIVPERISQGENVMYSLRQLFESVQLCCIACKKKEKDNE